MDKYNRQWFWPSLTAVTVGILGLGASSSLAQTEPLLLDPPDSQSPTTLPPARLAPTSLSPAPQPPANLSLLKSGDQVGITVVGFPEFSGQQRVAADGTIQLPLTGSIQLGGLTPDQATTAITTALYPYVRRPQVSVTLLSIRPPRISITGEVRRPGPYLVVPPDLPKSDTTDVAGGDFQTLSYALILAGGVTPDADLRNIIIRRQVPGGTKPAILAANNAQTELKVDLWQVIQSGDLGVDLRIYDGDEIVVPMAQLSGSDQQTLLASTVAPTAITVQVAGEVRRPGTVQVPATADMNTAIAAAGGPTNEAQSSIGLFRMAADGRLTQQTLELGDNSGPLRDGDILLIERTRTVDFLTFLNLLMNPLGDLANVIRTF